MATDTKKEHTTIGLNRSTMAMVGVIIALLSAGAFWRDRGGSEATAAAAINQGIMSNTSRNDSQDKQIVIVQKDIKDVSEEQHKAEIARVEMVGAINQTKNDVGEIKDDFKELKGYLMQYDFKPKKEE